MTVYLGATAEHREGIAAIGAREDANGANRQHKQTYSRRGVRPSSSQHGVPNCRRGSTLNSPTAESELTFANAAHQLDAGDRDCCVPEVLEAQHHSDALLHAPMVLVQIGSTSKRMPDAAFGLQACGYVPVRNPDAADGLWKIRTRRQVIYSKASLSVRDQLIAKPEIAGRSIGSSCNTPGSCALRLCSMTVRYRLASGRPYHCRRHARHTRCSPVACTSLEKSCCYPECALSQAFRTPVQTALHLPGYSGLVSGNDRNGA